jgi:phage minor structural protein
LDTYGGEYEFDRYKIHLHDQRGADRGVSIRYGKNLTTLEQDRNCANVYTGVYPYWVDADGANLVELDEKIVNAPGDYDFVRIKTLDMSMHFTEQPTQDELRSATEEYISSNKIGVPNVSLSVSFVQLDQSLIELESLDKVSLFDIVNVEFPKIKVSATAKVVKIVYDVILERFKKIVLGEVKKNYTDSVQSKFDELNKKIRKIESSVL